MKQTFIVGVETDKKDFNEWIADHDKQIRGEVIEEFADKIKEHSSFHYVDCDGYGGLEELIFKVEDWLDDIIETMRSEVEE